jgi:hypothetical protein
MPRKRVDPNALTESECYGALEIDHGNYYEWTAKGPILIPFIDQGDQVALLAHLDRFVAAIGNIDEHEWAQATKGGQPPSLQDLDLGYDSAQLERFIQLVEDCHVQNKLQYSEPFQIFTQAYIGANEWAISLLLPQAPVRQNLKKRNKERECKLIQLLHSAVLSKPYKRRLSHRKEAATNNYKAGGEFLNTLFDTHSKLQVARIELGYAPKKWATLAAAKIDLQKFWNHARGKSYDNIFGDLVGYAKKLEFSSLKGYHFHLILLFDETFPRDIKIRVTEVGDFWKQITKGRGDAFDCRISHNEFHQAGIGVVRRADQLARDRLLKYGIEYLTIKDQYLKPFAPKTRIFETSQEKSLITKRRKQEEAQRVALERRVRQQAV